MCLPTVSIIIPTKNRVAHLRRCLEALIEQEYPNHGCEIIVVDDGSLDDTSSVTADMRARFTAAGKTVCYMPSEGRGTNAAINTGLKARRTQVVVTIGDDTLPPCGWLKALVHGLVCSGAEAVSGPLRIPVPGPLVGKHREEVASCLTEVVSPVYWQDGSIVPVAGNMAVWRHVLERGFFDQSVKAPVEEIDWVLRADVRSAFIPEAWVWHSKEGDALRLERVLRTAWHRGSEGGWWLRERVKMPEKERLSLVLRSVKTCSRAFGHATLHRCWGGVVVGLGELAKALALVGFINQGKRNPSS